MRVKWIILIFICFFSFLPSFNTVVYGWGISGEYSDTGKMIDGRIKARVLSYDKFEVEATIFNRDDRGGKIPRNGYLFCVFLRKHDLDYQWDYSKAKELIIKIPGDQYCNFINGTQTVEIDIPDEAQYAAFWLYTDETTTLPTGEEGRFLGQDDRYLFELYGVIRQGEYAAWLALER